MIFIYAFYLYFFTGIAIGIWFGFFKAAKIDSAAAGTSFWFKLIILAGTTLLWPMVLYKLSFTKKGAL